MKKNLKVDKRLKDAALEFINSGISCNCLVLLKELNLLDFLLLGNSIDKEMLSDPHFCSNYTAACSAFVTLEYSGVLTKNLDKFSLSDFGYALCDYIGLILMLFDGYGSLMSEQKKIALNRIKFPSKLMKGDSIAEASIDFGKDTVDPIISKIFKRYNIKGTICDLGCGIGARLSWLCHETGNSGLGIENNDKALHIARNKFKSNKSLSFEKGDICHLEGVWEDVAVVMQYFVFHDFVINKNCVSILNSCLDVFPNLKFFIYVDVLSSSDGDRSIMPGYDYVHGLLGISTPTYNDIIKLFNESNYFVIDEFSMPNMPNTFTWILVPKKLHHLWLASKNC